MILECGSAKRLPLAPPPRSYKLHRVVNRQPRGHRPTRRIDIEMNILVRVFRFQIQELRHDKVGHLILKRPDNENHPLLQKTRVNIVGPLAPGGLLDDHWDKIQCFCAHKNSRCLLLGKL
jgi:hypothetical protein